MELPEFQRICLGPDSLRMCLEDLCEHEEDEKPGNDILNKSYRYGGQNLYKVGPAMRLKSCVRHVGLRHTELCCSVHLKEISRSGQHTYFISLLALF